MGSITSLIMVGHIDEEEDDGHDADDDYGDDDHDGDDDHADNDNDVHGHVTVSIVIFKIIISMCCSWCWCCSSAPSDFPLEFALLLCIPLLCLHDPASSSCCSNHISLCNNRGAPGNDPSSPWPGASENPPLTNTDASSG